MTNAKKGVHVKKETTLGIKWLNWGFRKFMDKKQKKMCQLLKDGLAQQGVSHRTFCNSFYEHEISHDFSEDEIENHYERFKKVLAGKRKTPEIVALYFSYFKTRYLNDQNVSPESRKAAWEFYIELDSRIVKQTLKYGDEKSALDSLYLIFSEWRKISKSNGYQSSKFYHHSKDYMNGVLRQFVSKWHELFSKNYIDYNAFRDDLMSVQQKTTVYLDLLQKDFYFNRFR